MAASKKRLLWTQVPAGVRSVVETIAGAPVIAAENCPGGFSAGLASRLRLANGDRAFVKAIDGLEWPSQMELHRAEVCVAAALPPGVPAPRFRGSYDDGEWVAPYLDLVTVLSTAPSSGIDPESVIDRHHLTAGVDSETIDAALAALAGFQLGTGLHTAPPGLEPIAAAKLELGKSTLHWLARRLDGR